MKTQEQIEMEFQKHLYDELNIFANGDLEGFLRDNVHEEYTNNDNGREFTFQSFIPEERIIRAGYYRTDEYQDGEWDGAPIFQIRVKEGTAEIIFIEDTKSHKDVILEEFCCDFLKIANNMKKARILELISREDELFREVKKIYPKLEDKYSDAQISEMIRYSKEKFFPYFQKEPPGTTIEKCVLSVMGLVDNGFFESLEKKLKA